MTIKEVKNNGKKKDITSYHELFVVHRYKTEHVHINVSNENDELVYGSQKKFVR